MAKVFISYSKRDYIGDNGQVIPNNVIDMILNVLTDNNISYWIDREGLDLGTTYAETISKKIKDCDTFLFISTKNSPDSLIRGVFYFPVLKSAPQKAMSPYTQV